MASAYEPVIGLEVHAQLMSATKLFSSAPAAYGGDPNTRVSPVCLGLPGSLPVPNRTAVRLAVRAALALGLKVQERSRFDRKHYFYPDLPKGYQISQFERPIALDGELEVETPGGTRAIRIQRIHMEEDAAKNVHDSGSRYSLIDFNRAGVPLIEIVTHPDLKSAEEAEAYLRKLRDVLMFAGVNDGNLEEGSFRCDANVSIRPVGTEKLGTRVELKNINSFRFVRLAIDGEIARQEALLRSGGAVVQETRGWVETEQKTISLRGKEEAHDYRYFPDPDLPELVLTAAEIDSVRAELPELPEALVARWTKDLGLTDYDAGVLTGHPAVAVYFDEVARLLGERFGADKRASAGKRAANFVQAEVLRDVKTEGLGAAFPLAAAHVAELLALVEDGSISGKMAKDVYAEACTSGRSPRTIVDEKGLAQVSDPTAIEAEARRIIDANPKHVAEYKGGKSALLGFFVGQVIRSMKGAANPQMTSEIVKRLLGG